MAAGSSVKIVLLTGPPGVGKTTLIQNVCRSLEANQIAIHGFITEEVRQSGKRIGFDVVRLGSTEDRTPLARVNATEWDGPYVGQYQVNVVGFESLAMQAMTVPSNYGRTVLVLDEVGKMELWSSRFQSAVRSFAFSSSPLPLLVSVPLARGKPLTLVDELLHHPNAKLFHVSRENRDGLCDTISSLIIEMVS